MKLCLLLLTCVLNVCLSQAQSASWFEGMWDGETYFPNGPITKRILVKLKVNEVTGNTFIAQLANMYPNDTTVRLERMLSGNITDNCMTITNSAETYILDPRTRNFWSDCTQCPTQSCFSMQGNDVIITITTTGCSHVCDGETIFHRNINTFDSADQNRLAELFGLFKKDTTENTIKTTNTVITTAVKEDTVATKLVLKKEFVLPIAAPVKKDTIQKAIIVKAPVVKEVITQTAMPAKDSLYIAFAQRASSLVNTYEVTSPHITVQLFDNAQIDGDVVSIFHNNQLIADHQILTHKAITFTIDASAENRHHEFVLVADNLGLLPPNTALLRITAGSQKYELEVASDLFTNAKIAIDYTGK